MANELVYKIYLLLEESIRRLYQQRLTKNLSEYCRASTIDEEWEHIKSAIKKATQLNKFLRKMEKVTQTTLYWGTGIALLEMSRIGALLVHME